MSEPATPRPRPCPSCPYRRDVPSAVWEDTQYQLLEAYDGDMAVQRPNPFFCHQGDNHICSGWLAHKDPMDLLAVRIGIAFGRLDPSCADYYTDVELFESGEEAATHGMQDYKHPSAEARKLIEKIKKVRAIPGRRPLENG